MPPRMVEVDETQLLASNRVTATVSQMLAKPEARKLLLQAQKLVQPDTPIPELDAKNEVLDAVAQVNKRLDDEAAARQKEREDREAEEKTRGFQETWNQGKRDLARRGYTDEAVTEIEKLAQERGIVDLEAASALFDRIHPPASATSSAGFGNWGLFEPPAEGTDQANFLKAMIESRGDDDAALSAEISKTLMDIRGQSRRAA